MCFRKFTIKEVIYSKTYICGYNVMPTARMMNDNTSPLVPTLNAAAMKIAFSCYWKMSLAAEINRTFTMCPFAYAELIQLPSLFACRPVTVGRRNVPEKTPFRRLRNNSL
ncbi:hypothetical protein V3C99_008355 [Haemonchus contortus]